MPAEAAWAEERLLLVGDLRQCVTRNGRVHVHTIEKKR